MATVAEIHQFLDSIAPVSMQCLDKDNNGLLCGSESTVVTKILVALDPFEHVCREAVEIGAQLIVTHHPLIFRPLRSITDEVATNRGVMLLCANGISALNAHTNLDCTPGGVNDVLAQTLGLTNVEVIDPMGEDAQGRPWGLLRKGEVECQSVPSFLEHVKAALKCEGLRYVDGGRPVRNVAVGGGSCADFMIGAMRAGCDTFVTSDISYNEFWDAKERGMTLIDAGHFCTENPVCTYLQTQLQKAFPEIQVVLSEKHADPINFFC